MNRSRYSFLVALPLIVGGVAFLATPSLADTPTEARGAPRCEIATTDLGGGYPGVPPVFDRSSATAINDRGQVVGGASAIGVPPDSNGYTPMGAVLWERDGTRIDLGHLPGTTSTAAIDINNQGTIVGNWFDSRRISHGLVWSPAPGGGYTITDLGEGRVTAINNTGMIVGGLENEDDPLNYAVVWDRQFNPTRLPTLPGGSNGYAAEGINDRGTIVGLGADDDGNIHGVIWTPGPGGSYTISDLGLDARPLDINNQGTIVGSVETETGANDPAVWTPTPGGGYTMTVLGVFGQATAINDAGQIFGMMNVNNRFVSVLWSPAPGGGYTTTVLGGFQGNDINNSGQAVGQLPNRHGAIWEGLHPGCTP